MDIMERWMAHKVVRKSSGISPESHQFGKWIRVMVCGDCHEVVHVLETCDYTTEDGSQLWRGGPPVCPLCGYRIFRRVEGERQVYDASTYSARFVAKSDAVWYLPWTWFSMSGHWEVRVESEEPPSDDDDHAGEKSAPAPQGEQDLVEV